MPASEGIEGHLQPKGTKQMSYRLIVTTAPSWSSFKYRTELRDEKGSEVGSSFASTKWGARWWARRVARRDQAGRERHEFEVSA